MHEGEETQARGDAMEARDLVLGLALGLALRAIEHVEAHEGVEGAVLAEELDAGGHAWKIRAHYMRGHTFVRVDGEPETRHGAIVSLEEIAAIMGNQSAQFSTSVPRAWVELAARAAEERPT